MFESLVNKVTGLQGCFKIFLFHPHLGFYFSLGKTFTKLSINYVLLKNVKYKVMFKETHI